MNGIEFGSVLLKLKVAEEPVKFSKPDGVCPGSSCIYLYRSCRLHSSTLKPRQTCQLHDRVADYLVLRGLRRTDHLSFA